MSSPISLSDIQRHVDNQIESRIRRICNTEWRKQAMGVNGKRKRRRVVVTYPQEVKDLLELRQRLYGGEDPEAISATLLTGEINYLFLAGE